jgi:large subunit ribosomal protein L17
MRHHNSVRKFGRTKDQRNALMRSLASSLILKEKIATTEAKAKELRPMVEKLITKAKKPTLATRRLLTATLGGEKQTKKLIEIISPKYADRNGGYTRILKLPNRRSDGSKRAYIEFV